MRVRRVAARTIVALLAIGSSFTTGAGPAALAGRTSGTLALRPLLLAEDFRTRHVFVVEAPATPFASPTMVCMLDARTGVTLKQTPLAGRANPDSLLIDERAGRVFVDTGLGTGAALTGTAVSMLDSTSGALIRTTATGASTRYPPNGRIVGFADPRGALGLDTRHEQVLAISRFKFMVRSTAPPAIEIPVASLSVLDATTGAPSRMVQLGRSSLPVAIAVDDRQERAFLASAGDQNLVVLDALLLSAVHTVQLRASPCAVLLDRSLGRAIAVDGMPRPSVAWIDERTGALLRDLPLGAWVEGSPCAVALSEPSHLLFVQHRGVDAAQGELSAIDTRAGRVARTLACGTGPVSTLVAQGNYLYVVTQGVSPRYNGTLTVFDIATGALLQTMGLPGCPNALAVDPLGHHAFISFAQIGNRTPGSVRMVRVAS